MTKCLVCGKPVDEQRWVETGADKAKQGGVTYFFCGLQCKNKFINTPDQYLAKQPQASQPT